MLCESKDDIDWVYKNGDKGIQYFSVVYGTSLNKQYLFYPDYIIRKTNGEVWIIETKGGEIHGQSKNIDIHSANKFLAFQKYSQLHAINWGFVRDKDNRLYINNTSYTEDMGDDSWELLSDKF